MELDRLVCFPTGARLKGIKVLEKTGFSRIQVELVHLFRVFVYCLLSLVLKMVFIDKICLFLRISLVFEQDSTCLGLFCVQK